MAVIGMSVGLSLARRVTGERLDPYSAYNFSVEIEGLTVGGFTDVSGLSISTDVERKMFGGENDKEYIFIKGTKQSDITLKHGLTDLDLLWSWYDDVTKGKIERKSGSIHLRDHLNDLQSTPAMSWNFIKAIPIKWDGPTFNSTSNTVATETLVLAHQGLIKP